MLCNLFGTKSNFQPKVPKQEEFKTNKEVFKSRFQLERSENVMPDLIRHPGKEKSKKNVSLLSWTPGQARGDNFLARFFEKQL